MAEHPKLTIEEKKKLNSERQKAVREAWSKEKDLVALGEGTRDWTPEQQKEIMENGRVDGYEGHHMKSVSNFPDQAGNPDNIQMLTEREHFEGAHQGNFHTKTNGYYNPDTGQMENFKGDELRPVEAHGLSEPSFENGQYTESAQVDSASAFNASVKNSGQSTHDAPNKFHASVKENNVETENGTQTPKYSEAISR